MKIIRLIGLIVVFQLFVVTPLIGQNRRVLSKELNASTFTEGEKFNGVELWGLEVDHEVVLEPQYRNVYFQNGLFLLEGIEGRWVVCDKTGDIKTDFIKASGVKVTAQHVLFENAKGNDAVIYDRSTWQQVKAQQITAQDMYEETKKARAGRGTSFNPKTAQQRIAVDQAEKVSAEEPFGAFSFSTNSQGQQELIVDDEVLFTADSFDLFLEPSTQRNIDFFKQTGRWIFRVAMINRYHKMDYGLYVLDIKLKDGEKNVAGKLSIPCKYMGVWHDTHTGYAKCEVGGFKPEEYRNVNGILMDTKTRKPKE